MAQVPVGSGWATEVTDSPSHWPSPEVVPPPPWPARGKPLALAPVQGGGWVPVGLWLHMLVLGSRSIGLYPSPGAWRSLAGCSRAGVRVWGAFPKCRGSPGLSVRVWVQFMGCFVTEYWGFSGTTQGLWSQLPYVPAPTCLQLVVTWGQAGKRDCPHSALGSLGAGSVGHWFGAAKWGLC